MSNNLDRVEKSEFYNVIITNSATFISIVISIMINYTRY